MFFWNSLSFYDPTDVGNLIFDSFASSKSSLNIWKLSVHILLSLAWRILSITLLVCEMSELCSSLSILWYCLSLGLEWKLTFSSSVATAEFSKFAGILSTELSYVQAGFRKGRGIRDQISNIHWIIEKAREFQKNIYFCFINYAKAFDHVNHNNCWKF